MQGEMYTAEAYGAQASLQGSPEKLAAEQPEYYGLNRAADASRRHAAGFAGNECTPSLSAGRLRCDLVRKGGAVRKV